MTEFSGCHMQQQPRTSMALGTSLYTVPRGLTMANLDLRLACGTAIFPNKRCIVTDQPSILFVWKFILVVQLNANPSEVDCIIQSSGYKYMHRNCFGSYQSIVDGLENLKSLLIHTASTLNLVLDSGTGSGTETAPSRPAGARPGHKRAASEKAITDVVKLAKRIKTPVVHPDLDR